MAVLGDAFHAERDTQTHKRVSRRAEPFAILSVEYRLTGVRDVWLFAPDRHRLVNDWTISVRRERYGANVIGVERWRRFRRVIVNVNGFLEFLARDCFAYDMSLRLMSSPAILGEQLLEPMVLRGEYFSDQALDVGMAEISLIP